MPLLDKNGKPYQTFSRPNPLMKDQTQLSQDQLVFHNFQWQPTVVEVKKRKSTNPAPVISRTISVEEPAKTTTKEQSKEITDFLDLLKKEAKTLKESSPVEPEIELNEQDATVIVHCHPVIQKQRVDDLYGETRTKTSYGVKFDFDALIVDQNDFEMILYTTNSTLTKGSIIYPSKYKDGEPLEMFRWWKISQIENNQNGFLIFGQLTEKVLDFSE